MGIANHWKGGRSTEKFLLREGLEIECREEGERRKRAGVGGEGGSNRSNHKQQMTVIGLGQKGKERKKIGVRDQAYLGLVSKLLFQESTPEKATAMGFYHGTYIPVTSRIRGRSG